MLWFLQVLQDTYNATIKIPIVVREIPSDIAISEEIPEYISVEVRDNGFELLNYSLSGAIEPIELSFTPDESREGYYEWSTGELDNELYKRFGVGGKRTVIISFSPQYISFTYSPKAKREVPIDFKGQVISSLGTIITDLTLDPDKVIVYGNKNDIDTLKVIRTDTLTFSGFDATTSFKMPLIAPEGVSLTPSHVSINVTVEQLVQRRFLVPISHNYSGQQYVLRLFPAFVDVVCVVPESKVGEISASDIMVELEESDIHNSNSKGKLKLQITKYPDYVQVIQAELDQVEYIFEEK
ncbi:CdaR family protein [Porphyromonas sp.]|uniref:CdaR family protein n=1 Tax=Porphyromonas sp. TaxID=1924944 RepID=UPI0026DA9D94|nr:CdaR family protein [Porphyromonas sp.]MDO4770848.1 CdaR family protein [Porphyromonas sp.]